MCIIFKVDSMERLNEVIKEMNEVSVASGQGLPYNLTQMEWAIQECNRDKILRFGPFRFEFTISFWKEWDNR